MEQDSTNKGSGEGRPNWRDRLGVNKDSIPTVSGKFSGSGDDARANLRGERRSSTPPRVPEPKSASPGGAPAESNRPPRGDQPPGGRAPMAPRASVKPAEAAPVSPENATFSDKLKAQREAAERLADQRVASGQAQRPKFSFAEDELKTARDETAPKVATPPAASVNGANAETPGRVWRPTPPGQQPEPAAPAQRPPFPQNAGDPSGQPPVRGQINSPANVPGQKTQLPGVRPASAPYNGAPGQDPVDHSGRAPSNIPGQQHQGQPPVNRGRPPQDPRGYSQEPDYGQPPVGRPGPSRGPAAGPPRGYDPRNPDGYRDAEYPPQGRPDRSARTPDPRGTGRPGSQQNPAGYDDYDDYDPRYDRDPGPGVRRPGRASLRNNDYYQDDYDDDVFQDEMPRGRGRPGADDYNDAYREFDDNYDLDEGEKKGVSPLFILLGMLAIAIIASGLIWAFFLKSDTDVSSKKTETPVVEAPADDVKAPPLPKIDEPVTATPKPQGKKQIYDRILGEETLEESKLSPSEEAPKAVEAPELPGVNDPNQGQIPEPEPLQLPPPPGVDEQGNLELDGKSNKVGLKSDPEVPGADQKSDQQQQVADAKSDQQSQEIVMTPTADQQTAQVDKPADVPKPKVRPQKIVELKKKKEPESDLASNQVDDGTGPVSILPSPDNNQQAQLPPQQPAQNLFQQQVQQQQQIAQPRKRIRRGRAADDDPLEGSRNRRTQTNQLARLQQQQQQQSLQQQIAALPQQQIQPAPAQPQPVQPVVPQAQQPQPVQPQPAQPAQPAAPSGQYVAQLGLYSSREQAIGAFNQLRARHPGLISGLSPRVAVSDLGATGKFYRLQIGTFATKQQVSNLCNRLIVSGQPDCLQKRL